MKSLGMWAMVCLAAFIIGKTAKTEKRKRTKYNGLFMISKCRLQFSLAATVLCLFASCSSSKQEGMKDITLIPTYKVEGVKYNQEEIVARNAWEFHRIGENFFIFNALPNSAALVVRMSDCRELGEFMPRGMGPGECKTPRYAGCSAGEDTIYMYDTYNYGVSDFVLPVQRQDTLRYDFIRDVRSLQQELHGPTYRLENGSYVGFRLFGTRHLFSLLDERMDTICTFGNLPLPVEDDELKSFNAFQCVTTAEKNTIYYGSKFFPYMCAYEVKGKDNIELKFQHNYIPPVYDYTNGMIRFDGDKTKEGFMDMKINGDYIWTTIRDEYSNEIRKDPNKSICKSIILFNKKGEPLARYELPIRGSKFCFSKDGKRMFLFTIDCDIYEFQVSDFLKHIE